VLDAFEARKQAGEDTGTLTWHEVAETANGTQYGKTYSWQVSA
jgi:hypothetical protein